MSTATLGVLIARLEQEYARNPDLIVHRGFADPHSYRGYYHNLAFEPRSDVPLRRMLEDARFSVDTTFQGYKGGDYTMTLDTEVWLAEYGHLGETIGPVFIDLMLSDSRSDSAIEVAYQNTLSRVHELKDVIIGLRSDLIGARETLKLALRASDGVVNRR